MNHPFGWNVCVYSSDPLSNNEDWMVQQALDLLQPDHWMSYWWWPEVDYPGFVPMIWGWPLQPDHISDVQRRMLAHPEGETWLLINEGHLREQANITPERGVEIAIQLINAAHQVKIPINLCGPNAAINMPAQAPGRLSGAEWNRQFLRALRLTGIPAMSLNGIHLYNSTDERMVDDIWRMLLADWRKGWLGTQPIVITEFCAENEPYAKQAEVMDAVFELYQTGRREGPAGQNGIMGAFWFSAFEPAPFWPNCNLTEKDPDKSKTMRLTPLGQHWLDLKARSI